MTQDELQTVLDNLLKALPKRCSPADISTILPHIILAYDMTDNWSSIMLATTVSLGEQAYPQIEKKCEAIVDANNFLERIVNAKS